MSPLTGGAAVGAGALGGLGAKGLIGRLSGAAVTPGASASPPVGSTVRSASSGVLGGRGAGAAGQPVSRSAGGARGAGGGGGRGAGGARGAGAAVGRGGRKKDERNDTRESEYDVEEDWLDDEGSPGVLD